MWKSLARRARRVVAGSVSPLVVERAVVLDGRRVWVTLDAPSDGHLVAVASSTGRATTFAEPVPAGFRTVVVDPTELGGGDEEDFLLHFAAEGVRRPLTQGVSVRRPTDSPYLDGGAWHYRIVQPHEALVLRRRRAPAFRPVLHLRQPDDALEITWRPENGDSFVLLPDAGVAPPAEVVAPGRVRLSPLGFPESDVRATAAVRNGDDLVELRRSRNDLVRPNGAVVLPEVETDRGTLLLAWARDGSLRVIWKVSSC